MAVKIQWLPPSMLEERKQAQWERIIRSELGEGGDPFDVSLSFEAQHLHWKVEATKRQASGAMPSAETRGRVVQALRATGKPVV